VSQIADDNLKVRILTLADHAVVAQDQKIYINGGGVAQMGIPEFPGQLGPLWLAIRLHIPWNMTSDSTTLRIRVLDADRNPVGPDPIVEGNMEMGRAPGLRPGDENPFNLAVPLIGFPVQAQGVLYFHLIIGSETVGVLPLKVSPLAAVQRS
jgi:hypothetical protein